MLRFCCTAQFVAVLALSGCGTVELFGRYDLPEDPKVETAPWPRLVDTPTAPPVGEYSAAAPNPERGKEVERQLSAEATVAAVRAGDLAEPVIPEADREAMLRRARRPRP